MHEGVHSGNVRAQLFVDEKGQGPSRRLIVGGREITPYALSWAGKWLNLDPSAIDRDAGAYANLGRSEWHGRNKIVVRRTGDRVMAAFDPHGFYVSNNLFVLLDTRFAAREPLAVRYRQAVVALLNSRFMTWYFRTIQPRKGKLFAELKLVHLRDFPMPRPERWREVEERLAQLAEHGLRQGTEAVRDEVNALVESAFDFSPAEREMIRLCQ